MVAKQDTLYDRICDDKELTEDEINELVKIFGHRCQQRTKKRLYYALLACPNMETYGIYRRVHLDPPISYCAGQSYPDEIRTVRQCLIGR
jgi:hypothetical protein